jgi:RNA polymerase sigma factor (TIGR02999 family)
MSDVTRIFDAVRSGQAQAADELLPLVYTELRRLAARKLSHEPPGQTLDATGLVHEAYLRIVSPDDGAQWENRGHFFAAAAEAMRRILVESARRKQSLKRGGDWSRHKLDLDRIAPNDGDDLLDLNAALEKLAAAHPKAGELVKLRYFAGLTIPEAAEALGVSPRTADSYWAYARAWLLAELDSRP